MNVAITAAVALSVAGVVLGAAPVAADDAAETPPTFSNEVVRIFQRSCQSCHHDGDIAPFPLVAPVPPVPVLYIVTPST